jgi:hypothetical protein
MTWAVSNTGIEESPFMLGDSNRSQRRHYVPVPVPVPVPVLNAARSEE